MFCTGRSTRSIRCATLLGVPSVHAIGYCVAGTTLAATLGDAGGARARRTRCKSATFFTAQVDFSKAGDLKLFIDDEHDWRCSSS